MAGAIILGATTRSEAGPNRWTSLGPDRGAVYGLAADPNDRDVLWAVTLRGIFRSTDGGLRWTLRYDGFDSRFVHQLLIDPEDSLRLIALVDSWPGEEVYVSEDAGLTWTRADLGGHQASARLLWTSKPFMLFLNNGDGGVQSSDGGLSWERLDLPKGTSLAAVHSSDSMRFLIWRAGESPAISTDGGESWRACGILSEGRGFAAFDPSRPDTIAIAHSYGPITISEDACTSWEVRTAPENNHYGLTFDPRRQGTLLIAGEDGMARSTDLGRTWHQFGPPGVRALSTVAVLPAETSNQIYITAAGMGEQRGVIFSSDDGASWEVRMKGLRAADVWTLAVDASHPETITAALPWLGIYRSTDSGLTWSFLDGSKGVGLGLAVDPTLATTLYSTRYPRFVVRSDDGGLIWNDSGPWPTSRAPSSLMVDPLHPNTVFAIDEVSASAWRSDDRGATWSELGTGRSIFSLTVNEHIPGRVYTGLFRGGVSRSTDHGDTWQTANSGLESEGCSFYCWCGDYWDIFDVAVDPSSPDHLLAATWVGPYRSSDAGESWKLVRDGLEVCCELDDSWEDPWCPGASPKRDLEPQKCSRGPTCEGYPITIVFDSAGVAYTVTSKGTFQLRLDRDAWVRITDEGAGVREIRSLGPGVLIGASSLMGVVRLDIVDVPSPRTPGGRSAP